MNGLPGYYGQPYGIMDPQSMQGYAQGDTIDTTDPIPMDPNGMGQSQTLHQIISQNNEQLMRTRTFQTPYRQTSQDHNRRASLHEFGSVADSDLANFQFDPNPDDNMAMATSVSAVPLPQKAHDPRRVRSREDLALNTRFSQMSARFGDMSAVTSYSPAMMPAATAGLDASSAYNPQGMDLPMDFDPMGSNTNPMHMDVNAMNEPIYSASPIAQQFSMPYLPTNSDGPAVSSASPLSQNPMSSMRPSQNMPAAMPQSFARPQNPGRIQSQMNNHLPTTSAPNSAIASPLHIQMTPNRRQSMEMAPPLQMNSMLFDTFGGESV